MNVVIIGLGVAQTKIPFTKAQIGWFWAPKSEEIKFRMPIRLLAGSKVAPLKQGFSGHGDRTKGANGETHQGTTTGYYPGPLDPKWLDSAI